MNEQMDDLRPWVPDGARPFQVGDRVRVRLSEECDKAVPPSSLYARLGEKKFHGHLEEGLSGVVYFVHGTHSHNVEVEVDPIDIGDGKTIGRILVYAPSELELLEADR